MCKHYRKSSIKWINCVNCETIHPTKLRTNPNSAMCKKCTKEWDDFKKNSKYKHLKQAVFWNDCNICGRKFTSGSPNNADNCSFCEAKINQFRKQHGLNHFVVSIKYVKCEICNANHAVNVRNKSKSRCHVCRDVKTVSYKIKECEDCSCTLVVINRNHKQVKRCKPCQKEHKKKLDRELQAKNRQDEKLNEILKQRCRDYRKLKRIEKYTGTKTDIFYSDCINCGDRYVVNDKRNEYACPDCEPKLKPISITYKNCIDCGALESMKLQGTNGWERCEDCKKERNRQLTKEYRKADKYKERRREYKRKTGLNNHRKRARKYGVYYEPVNKTKVFKRDKYKCSVCGCKCNKTNNNPKQATLGHIIPLSLGGAHTYSNVRTECRECNVNRGIKCSGEQITLFTSL